MSKWVYNFGVDHNEGRAEMRNLLGGKGANLAEMANRSRAQLSTNQSHQWPSCP